MSKRAPERVKAPCSVLSKQVAPTRVGLLGTAALSGRYESSKAKYGWETDSKQVLWRKDEKDFEKRVKRSEIVEKEAVETDGRADGYRGDSLRSSYQSDGQNQVERVKKGFAVQGMFGLRDYCDFAKMVFTVPSWNTDQGV